MRPLSLCASAWLYECEAEWEKDGLHSVHIYEPLDLPAIEDARPSLCFNQDVYLYDASGNNVLGRCRHHDMQHPFQFLVRLGDGLWYEVSNGKAVWHNGGWYMRWWAFKNTEWAKKLNRV